MEEDLDRQEAPALEDVSHLPLYRAECFSDAPELIQWVDEVGFLPLFKNLPKTSVASSFIGLMLSTSITANKTASTA